MRPAPRTSLLALTFAVLALLAAGCGAGEVPADEVPGPPPALTVPTDSELGATGSNADASADATASEDAAATDDTTAESDTSGAAAPAAPEDTSGGTAAPPADAAPEDTTTDEQPPAAGSPPEQFESFCEQNAGAC